MRAGGRCRRRRRRQQQWWRRRQRYVVQDVERSENRRIGGGEEPGGVTAGHGARVAGRDARAHRPMGDDRQDDLGRGPDADQGNEHFQGLHGRTAGVGSSLVRHEYCRHRNHQHVLQKRRLQREQLQAARGQPARQSE